MGDYEGPAPRGGIGIAAPILRGLVAAALVFGGYWLVYAQDDGLPVSDNPSEVVEAPPPVAPPPPPPLAVPPPPTAAETGPVVGETLPPTARPDLGEGLRVQVLNDSRVTAEQLDDAVATLNALGYEVTPTLVAASAWDNTVVIASPGQEDDAQELAQVDPRFSVNDNPGLSTEFELHVIVGPDWEAAPTAGTTEPTPAATPTDGV